MNPNDELNGEKNHPSGPQSGDDSCILVEDEISTIQIDDTLNSTYQTETLVENGDNPVDCSTVSSLNASGAAGDETLGEFQVVDQVGDSEIEASGSQERTDGANETTETTAEFCAPEVVDLETTPQKTPKEPESRVLIDIKFQNKKTYLAFQEEFITMFKNYYKNKLDDMDISDDMSHNRIVVSEKVVKKADAFLVDKTPNNKEVEGAASTPTYRKSFGSKILTDEKEAEANQKSASSNQRNTCWNCDKDTHSLRDCPEPRNMKKVNKARNEFNRKELRYHDDTENEYGQMVPGIISDDLRAALGLSPSQIPLHVYRMRMYGYPPAWIEEAKIHNSGLSLFVEKDKKQLQPGVDEGETEDNDFKFDIQKIYDFPGFNVQPSHQYVDLHKVYNIPPMMPQHSKEEMIRSLGGDFVNGYKKRKIRESAIVDLAGLEEIADKTSVTVADMDIEDGNDETLPLGVTFCTDAPLPSESSSRPPEPMEDGECSNESRSASPNEDQLREQRKVLLAEIAESSVFLDTSSVNSSINITLGQESFASFNHSQLDSTIIENSENENRDNCAKDSASSEEPEARRGHVDTTIPGCPVLPSFSNYDNLPAGEKFQEGVCDVINFENLAESTGKYMKMKELIKKVRVFQQHHQKE